MPTTLRQSLDDMHVYAGDNRNFYLKEGLFGNNMMYVSRRYLEGPCYKHLLDRHVQTMNNCYQGELGTSVLFIIEKEDSD